METTQGQKSNRQQFSGLTINAGKVLSKACLYAPDFHNAAAQILLSDSAAVEMEVERFNKAREQCTLELDVVARTVAEKVGPAEAEIFTTQKHIVNDVAIVDKIIGGIRAKSLNVEFILSEVFKEYEHRFSQLDSAYLRERTSDISEIRYRLLNILTNQQPKFKCEGQSHCSRGSSRIIVASELTPDMVVNMNFSRVLGFVTEHGGISSHAAILARSLGIPAISGIRGIMDMVHCGDTVLLDGDNGMIYVNPDEKLIASLIVVEDVSEETVCVVRTPTGMEVLANVSLLDDALNARAHNADGIGLVRTEILFLKHNRLLSEDEQYTYYLQMLDQFPGKPVTFRMLDVGGDKPLPFLRIEQESNPYLGWRGARFLLGNPDIFALQLRALLRLTHRAIIKIMFPMVVDAHQQERLMSAAREVLMTADANPANVRFGAMFEVPSACMQAEKILRYSDFGSIGSNDLIQYLFAVDRNNERVSSDYNPDHPILWDILSLLVAAAKRENKPLSICGEMAGREGVPGRLLGVGISSLSVSPRLIPRVRNEMANYSAKKMTAVL